MFDRFRLPVAMAAAAVVGGVAYLHVHTLSLLALFPLLLTLPLSRRGALAVAVAFFAAPCAMLVGVLDQWVAGTGQPIGAFGIYGYPALLSLVLALPFALVNPAAPPLRRAMQMAVALLLLTLPPLGFIAWINPLMVAAALFPGVGLLPGLMLGLILLCLLVARPWTAASSAGGKVALALVLVVTVGAHNLDALRPAPFAPVGWYGIDTRHGPGLPSPEARDFRIALVEAQIRPYLQFPEPVLLVLPESLLPDFDPDDFTRLASLRAALHAAGSNVLIGVTPRIGENRWQNQLWRIGAAGEGPVAESRVPVPVGNWHLSGQGVPLDGFRSGLVQLDGRLAHVTICYEEFPLWAHLRVDRAEALVSVANQWMLNAAVLSYQNTSISAIQRLSRKPLVRATNRLPPLPSS